MGIQQQLQVTYKQAHAKDAIKRAIPAMALGFNVNTSEGDFSLHGEDALAVMHLVRELAERRAGGVKALSADGVKTYDHAFTVGFSVAGSADESGEDVTAEQMRDALRARINSLMDNKEMLEAVGAPFDTFAE